MVLGKCRLVGAPETCDAEKIKARNLLPLPAVNPTWLTAALAASQFRSNAKVARTMKFRHTLTTLSDMVAAWVNSNEMWRHRRLQYQLQVMRYSFIIFPQSVAPRNTQHGIEGRILQETRILTFSCVLRRRLYPFRATE